MKPKFKIGDEVVFDKAQKLVKKFNKDNKKERKKWMAQIYYVTDSNIETCYGGSQIHYTLRALAFTKQYDTEFIGVSQPTENNGFFRAREFELVTSPI